MTSELDVAERATSSEQQAEYRRVVEERFVTMYTEQRTLGFMAWAVFFCVALWALTLLPGARAFLRVSPLQMGLMMALQALTFIVATVCALSFGGVLGRPHRVAERCESAVTALVASGLIYFSGSVASFFWFLVAAHVLHSASDVANNHFVRVAHGGALALAALGFVHDGQLADAATLVFCGAVVLFLARTQAGWNVRIVELEVERNLLRRRVENMMVEQERQRIARDLHDGVGSQLAAMAWSADAILLDPSDSNERLRELSERARTGLKELRLVVNGLKAEDMQLRLLAAEVEQRCRLLVPERCRLTVEHRGELTVAHEACAQLELMIRESVHNAVQHAQADHIGVALAAHHDTLEVWVEDDGKGFAAGAAEHSRGGLAHLRERASALGASLDVGSSGAGTRVNIRLPLSRARA
jgi:signal transduction histidine kinase